MTTNFREYMRINPASGLIQFRTSVHEDWRAQDWPRFGWKEGGNLGLTATEAIEFADALKKFAQANNKPANWPPQENDVWMIDGVVYHAFLGAGEQRLMWRSGGGSPSKDSSSSWAGTLLETAKGKAELLFRVPK